MNWLLKDGRRMLLALPAVALVLCLVGLYLTRGSMANLSFLGDKNTGLVDQRPWQTVQALAPLAVSAEEQNFAQEAERLADHEVDQAFAQALREANSQTKTMTPEAQALSVKASQLEDEVKADKARVVALGGIRRRRPIPQRLPRPTAGTTIWTRRGRSCSSTAMNWTMRTRILRRPRATSAGRSSRNSRNARRR